MLKLVKGGIYMNSPRIWSKYIWNSPPFTWSVHEWPSFSVSSFCIHVCHMVILMFPYLNTFSIIFVGLKWGPQGGGGSVLPWSLKIMHWSPQIPEKNSTAPWEYFCLKPIRPINYFFFLRIIKNYEAWLNVHSIVSIIHEPWNTFNKVHDTWGHPYFFFKMLFRFDFLKLRDIPFGFLVREGLLFFPNSLN